MPEAATTPTDNALSNPPAGGAAPTHDNGIQLALNASDPLPEEGKEGQSAEGQATEAAPAADGGAAANGDDPSKKTPWFQRRIDALTAEKWEERREKENLRRQTETLLQQLADLRKGVTTTPPAGANAGPPPATDGTTPPNPAAPAQQQAPQRSQVTEAEINAMAQRRAEEIARTTAFTKACNDIYSNGKDDFQDFDQAMRTYQMLGGMPQPLLEIITEMPNAHKVLYKVGKDLDLAEKIVKMNPTRMAMELARVESGLVAKQAPVLSNAPRPVVPVDGNNRAETNPENMSTEQWITWREAELAKKRGR